MKQKKETFALSVAATDLRCPTGEEHAQEAQEAGKIPVLACEGGCIRGEIARLVANIVAKEGPFARACHAETFTVPDSAIAQWVKSAGKVVVIDGCFLVCHGRILKELVGEDHMIHFDILPFYKKYTDVFDIDDVPETERKATARRVADKVLSELEQRLGGKQQVVIAV